MRFCFFFFFSSRRRHTRFSRDWSSDVCSSDLGAAQRAEVAQDRSVEEEGVRLGVAGGARVADDLAGSVDRAAKAERAAQRAEVAQAPAIEQKSVIIQSAESGVGIAGNLAQIINGER